ncbi:MAG TPA: hypothetical protein VEX60_14015 [Pyrinomonadaceae bacterium]|nr:hypothetical protein [Pyrinomonadaceae bacterium]
MRDKVSPRRRTVRSSLALAIMLVMSLSSSALAVQEEKKKKKEVPQGTPVLWREPADIASRDLFHGPGGEQMKPDLSRVTFIKEEKGGYSKKYRVKDGAGRVWVAKLGKEAQSETAAVRLVWAVGYVSEINYLVPKVTIEGKGTFENVRFEARPEGVERLDEWRWDSNPFAGKRELQGLKVLMSLLENWDLKDSNNRVLLVRGADGNELRYIISDLGTTFGKASGSGSPMALLRNVKGSRNEPEDYVSDKFIERVEGDRVRLHYSGKNPAMMQSITVAEAEWIGDLLSRLSDRQIEDAFRAANYSADEVRLLAEAVRKRINELVGLQGGATSGIRQQ